MKRLPIYQVDAFADKVFAGNPAAVVPLDAFLPDAVLQSIAMENNLAETAFFVPRDEDGVFDLRWFTPAVEVDLCGHASLASAHVILTRIAPQAARLVFHTRSGALSVGHEMDGRLAMDFPALATRPIRREAEAIEILARTLGGARRIAPKTVRAAMTLFAVYDSEEDVRGLVFDPGLAEAAALANVWGVIATAPGAAGSDHDVVSRFFAPEKGVNEDPVTGSAHCALAPYWSDVFGKDRLDCFQASARGGHVACELAGERVILRGRCTDYLEGTISL
jgi:PhzF family phenazine biosynthesis protein